MLELFRMEVETQAAILNENLLALEHSPGTATELESLMRASHSIKGAARIVQLDPVVKIAHLMEDCFVAAQSGQIKIDSAEKIDSLLAGVDLIQRISLLEETELTAWFDTHQIEIDRLAEELSNLLYSSPDSTPQEGPGNDEPVSLSASEPPAETSLNLPSPEPISPVEIDPSMLALFCSEVAPPTTLLYQNLQQLQQDLNHPLDPDSLIQAIRLIKGAAKILQLNELVYFARSAEDLFLIGQRHQTRLNDQQIHLLLSGLQSLIEFIHHPETALTNLSLILSQFNTFTAALSPTSIPEILATNLPTETFSQTPPQAASQPTPKPSLDRTTLLPAPVHPTSELTTETPEHRPQIQSPNIPSKSAKPNSTDRVVRVSAENLNRLMGLAGESIVEANWLQPFADSLLKLRKQQLELYNLLEKLQESLTDYPLNQRAENYLSSSRQKANDCRTILSERLSELELFARRSANLSDRLYREVIASHMRPFADGVQGFPRMVRDLARQLNKQVTLEILGKSTQVDRDILEKLEAPLTHILRNALDHGIEPPEERVGTGKPAAGTVRLEAAHRGGMLSITITDDGRGVSLESLRQKIVNKGMVSAEMAHQLSESELMEFLFLPGFSTASSVTEISGRGVGLDIVQSMIQEVGGILRAMSHPGKGMSFHLQLPLTLSVIRTLLVEIAGEPYAFPLTRIDRILMLDRAEIATVENHQYFNLDHQKNIGLVSACQVLELPATTRPPEFLPVIIISDRLSSYGLAVDKFLGERDLVVRPLDPRLGKVPDINAAALMADGSPVLIIDVEDMVRSIDKLLTKGRLNKVSQTTESTIIKTRPRLLVVDDSITVREVERKMLENNGYEVDVAVNGMDGWNAIRTGHYDLVITDVDMPRMNGIELVSLIKNHPELKTTPVIIVSYKDREEDRLRGLEVGADYYLTKSSFHDNTLLKAVIDLIGQN